MSNRPTECDECGETEGTICVGKLKFDCGAVYMLGQITGEWLKRDQCNKFRPYTTANADVAKGKDESVSKGFTVEAPDNKTEEIRSLWLKVFSKMTMRIPNAAAAEYADEAVEEYRKRFSEPCLHCSNAGTVKYMHPDNSITQEPCMFCAKGRKLAEGKDQP